MSTEVENNTNDLNEEEKKFLFDRNFNEVIHEITFDSEGKFRGFKAKNNPSSEIISVITVGSMQSRFSIEEEEAILEGTDTKAKVFHGRLMNSKCVDLNNVELQYGVSYIVNYLDTLGVLYNGMSPSERINLLFKDGTPEEKYLGV